SQCVATVICDPYAGAIERDVIRTISKSVGVDYRPCARHLADRIVVDVRYPHVSSVESQTRGTIPHGEGTQWVAVTGAQLGQVVTILVDHPNVSAIKGDSSRTVPNWVGAHSGASGGKQFGDRSTQVVRDPDNNTVEGQGRWSAPHGKILTIPLQHCRFERVQRRPASAREALARRHRKCVAGLCD